MCLSGAKEVWVPGLTMAGFVMAACALAEVVRPSCAAAAARAAAPKKRRRSRSISSVMMFVFMACLRLGQKAALLQGMAACVVHEPLGSLRRPAQRAERGAHFG